MMALLAPVFVYFSVFHVLLLINPAHSKCPKSFHCGNLTDTLEFPLTNMMNPECGIFMVNCASSPVPTIQLRAGGASYEILHKVSTNRLFIRDPSRRYDSDSSICLSLRSLYLPESPSASFTISPNMTLFSCSNETYNETIHEHFKSYHSRNCQIFSVFYRYPPSGTVSNAPPGCFMFHLPVRTTSDQDSTDLFNLLTAEFALEWNVSDDCNRCHHRGGQCTFNNMNEFRCKGSAWKTLSLATGKSYLKRPLVKGFAAALMITIVLIGFIFIWRKKKVRKNRTRNNKDIELFLKNHEKLAPKRYEYRKLKKITNSFSDNLGKGGYGSVYKGELEDGRLVAVKILNESKGNGEEFINEVASISKTSHVNIVSLLGFCLDSSKRALIYEFMSNGSLEKFIHQKASVENRIGWEKLFEIAVGIARGLEYLHQGCTTRILHLDIKPHNILLDKDFKPKIADFGLAKLCTDRASTVSMLVARGTIGYIAPEVFCRNFGDVSYKSDVYSYGMMILEMVGKRKDNSGVDGTSEVYFPYNIYRDLEIDVENGGVEGDVNEDESQHSKRKLTIVGLWCIQTDPRDRPSMSMVLEMLERKLGSLQVPPKPQSSSPTTFAPKFSTSGSIYSY